jgi:two-component system sensor histidine kinase RegB
VRLPLPMMLALLAGLALFNLACGLRARVARQVGDYELLFGLGVDLLMLTAQLALSGGVNNPFVFLYLPQVAVAALLLRRGFAWAMVLAGALAIGALARWHLPLNQPLQWGGMPAQPLSLVYVAGLLVCFVICASLVVWVVVGFSQTLRRRDARLAALRQRAAEEDHIVRMGLLASGAAHELGTPLATLSVILGDWSNMAPIAAEPELREELEQMQLQVQRCKSIITGILMSAGQARAEQAATITLADFLAGVMVDWCERRGVERVAPEPGPLPELAIVADAMLHQMVTNVLAERRMQRRRLAAAACPGQRPRLCPRGAG